MLVLRRERGWSGIRGVPEIGPAYSSGDPTRNPISLRILSTQTTELNTELNINSIKNIIIKGLDRNRTIYSQASTQIQRAPQNPKWIT